MRFNVRVSVCFRDDVGNAWHRRYTNQREAEFLYAGRMIEPDEVEPNGFIGRVFEVKSFASFNNAHHDETWLRPRRVEKTSFRRIANVSTPRNNGLSFEPRFDRAKGGHMGGMRTLHLPIPEQTIQRFV
ncbi:MAG TPA: hypothetical protein VM120_04410 [Bryobacteraceae bacterium]|nr:hypothetical protein [Bryobacteraceae bacterium]